MLLLLGRFVQPGWTPSEEMGLRVVSDSDAYRESAAGHARATHFGSGKALNLLRIRIREFGTMRANRETIEDRARQFDVLAISVGV